MKTSPISPAAVSMNLIRRPLRDLLRQLRSLPVTESGEPAYAEADPDLLVRLQGAPNWRSRVWLSGSCRAIHRSRSRTANSNLSTQLRSAGCWSSSAKSSPGHCQWSADVIHVVTWEIVTEKIMIEI
jgi:hypothetical protein